MLTTVLPVPLKKGNLLARKIEIYPHVLREAHLIEFPGAL